MSESTAEETSAAAYLRSLPAIRERSEAVFAWVASGQSPHFSWHPDQMEAVADFVLEISRQAYPGLEIPPTSRWPDFQSDGKERLTELEARWSDCDVNEVARRRIDLVFNSVLMDAGAGPLWRYNTPQGTRLGLAEGIAAASLAMFARGLFSADPDNPWQVDARGLSAVSSQMLEEGFQIGADNPMPGVEGKWGILQGLSRALEANKAFFGSDPPRPGNLLDFLLNHQQQGRVPLATLWKVVMEGLELVWPGERIFLGGIKLGDVWPHSALRNSAPGGNLVPFHKLSQWLTYSLIPPLEAAGLRITETDQLTALAEYRNGGLFVDMGALRPKRPALLREVFPPGDEAIVEWRALTIVLVDRLAEIIRGKIGKSAAEFPLSKVIQGGTWQAGRILGRRLRENGEPPIRIAIDGTLL